MRSHRIYEIKRRFESACHLCQNQRFLELYFLDAGRGKDARVLYGARLDDERRTYMDFEIPTVDHKRPFYHNVVEGKPFMFTREEVRVKIQLQLLSTFLGGDGQPWALGDLWTQMGDLSGNSASTSDFKQSHEHLV